jgi:Skp family chaperone for outer membrane proteins
MFIKYLKSKLGVDDLQKEIDLLKKRNEEERAKLPSKFAYILSELTILRSTVQTKINAKDSKEFTAVAIEKLEKEIEQVAKIFTDEFVYQVEKINLAISQSEKKFEEQLTADFKKVNEQIAKLLAEVQECRTELQKKVELELELPVQVSSPINKNEAALYSFDVLDNNYLRALLKQQVITGYNSSEIKCIPDNYTLIINSNFKHLNGHQNRHCYDNALLHGKETKYIIHIGIIFPKRLLQKIFEGKDGTVSITPYLHAWNITELGKIADYTLGHKRAEEFVYVGRPLIDNIDNLTAKDVEKILRNETINNK